MTVWRWIDGKCHRFEVSGSSGEDAQVLQGNQSIVDPRLRLVNRLRLQRCSLRSTSLASQDTFKATQDVNFQKHRQAKMAAQRNTICSYTTRKTGPNASSGPCLLVLWDRLLIEQVEQKPPCFPRLSLLVKSINEHTVGNNIR
ncbi:hypothetical protein L3X38_043684 [Prunus dulcis]|uniref:Uncharacterized protein n=1 Tax=Prunus dulcis TaxID=3755 RepID=A0AAD4UXJ2_PRUDU|nr:hypothetical protein L3X38_043684 [Prunus dulcis]